MKHTYSRLCLKERWTLFILCAGVGIVSFAILVYSILQDKQLWMCISLGVAILMLGCCIFLYRMNKRRKEIKQEYRYEFDRELFAKERSCPKCGARIGSNVCFCPTCGTKFH